jgi:hypothetical protein
MSLSFSPDGVFVRTSTNGASEVLGTWRIEDKLLVVRMAETNYVTNRSTGKMLPLPLETRFHIVRAGSHELVLAQAPPMTMFGTNDEPHVSFTAPSIAMRFQR